MLYFKRIIITTQLVTLHDLLQLSVLLAPDLQHAQPPDVGAGPRPVACSILYVIIVYHVMFSLSQYSIVQYSKV